MTMKKIAFHRSGVALITVILIVLAASAIALLSLHFMHADTRTSMAFKYKRQAAGASHQAAQVMRARLNDQNALAMATVAQKSAIESAMHSVRNENKSSEEAWAARVSGAEWTYPEAFTPHTGLGPNAATTTDTRRFHGDLSRPIFQAGSVGNQSLNQKIIAGFSNPDAYCSKSARVESYGLVGQPILIRTNGGKHYLLADLNARISGFNREMGIYNIEPTPCQN